MSDIEVQVLARNWLTNPSKTNGRLYYKALMRHGLQQEALVVRSDLGYIEEIAALPRPTDKQSHAFAEYITSAHSWYKHLNATIPSRFYVYLRPDVALTRDGEPITANGPNRPFHYSDHTRKDWLENFGYWYFYVDTCYPNPKDFTIIQEELKIYAESRHVVILPQDLSFYAEVTNHVYGARFDYPYMKSIFGDDDGRIRHFDSWEGWRYGTEEELNKKRGELNGIYNAMQNYLLRLDQLVDSE